MALNMADFGKSCKSLQTSWKASYILENGFLTGFRIVWVHFGWIPDGPKLADFDQKPWAIAHGF